VQAAPGSVAPILPRCGWYMNGVARVIITPTSTGARFLIFPLKFKDNLGMSSPPKYACAF
jgi:hypothetical protein